MVIKVKILLFIIVALLCTNLISLSLLRQSEPLIERKQDIAHDFEFYQLEGTGEKWNVDNYKVLKTPEIIKRTSARLTYLGDDKEINESMYFTFEFIENDKVIYSNVYTSNDGPISILSNIDDLGSIVNELTEFDKIINRDIVDNTHLTITWKDSKGQLNEETIKLSIVDELKQ